MILGGVKARMIFDTSEHDDVRSSRWPPDPSDQQSFLEDSEHFLVGVLTFLQEALEDFVPSSFCSGAAFSFPLHAERQVPFMASWSAASIGFVIWK